MATPPWTPEPSQFTAPPPQRRGTSTGLIVTVVAAAVAVLLCLVGVAAVVVLRLRDSVDEAGGPGAAPAATSGAGQSTAAPAGSARCRWLAETPSEMVRDVGTPPVTVPARGSQTMTITTNRGVVKVEVNTAAAPCTAASMTYLASKKFFDGTKCHRLTTEGISVLQCGDPSGTGMGGPAYRFGDENLPVGAAETYPVGTVAMADTGQPDSVGSQFFIVWGTSQLGPDYTVLGVITQGLDVVKAIGRAGAVRDGQAAADGEPKQPVAITSITLSDPA
ncbi:hypothetical protein Cs7R123_59160 [Catellatospora sp. TT07R-123]|uniref:peptidylprolyl isomerase n=1 Tax=Catellatospora sp. TT07R-123 TaxID=2733863 RepID=UPI001B058B12|nr:peptidylprolyl isomerase [Catellatospora sp. TT07R-123]GHJ48574.1 hypothetical protein Cs7R123_59160 [Catellatospora sp. TT07R-123]